MMKQRKDVRDLDRPLVHLASLGCAKNLVDSERMLAKLATAGGLVGAAAEDADVIVGNTCGFIGPARDESVQTIREMLRYKEDGRCQRVVVMGCLVERDADQLARDLPGVDGFFGIADQEAAVAACGLRSDGADSDARLMLTPAHTAYLRISDGCDNGCAYCTIPLIRGRFRSRASSEILTEAEQLASAGVREINLIGQDTTLYGTDLANGLRIDGLINELAAIDGFDWIRLLYTHPAHFSDGLIDAYVHNPKLIPYVDLPLQHLDDDILARMGRGASQAESLDLISRLRNRVPEMTLRTTFILGFPGETEAQFETLLQLAQEIRFDHLGAFAYSREEGTAAALMPDQVPQDVVERRVERLMLAQQAIAFAANEARVGAMAQVLIDGSSGEPNVWIGRTPGQAPDVDSLTFVGGDDLQPGDLVDAEIVGWEDYDLVAEAL